jgi:hypothetical protein
VETFSKSVGLGNEQAGACNRLALGWLAWMPAFAGMTESLWQSARSLSNVMPMKAGIHASFRA